MSELAISMLACAALIAGTGEAFAAAPKPAKAEKSDKDAKAAAKPAAKPGAKPAAKPRCNLKEAVAGPLHGQLLGTPLENATATFHVAVAGSDKEPAVYRLSICQRREGASCGSMGPTVQFDIPSRAPGIYESAKIDGALYAEGEAVPQYEQKNPLAKIELVQTDSGELTAKINACFEDPQASSVKGEVPVTLVR